MYSKNYSLVMIGLLVSASYAHADVDLYGSIRAGYITQKTDNQSSESEVEDRLTRIGIKGSGIINKDLDYIFGVEEGFDLSNDAKMSDDPRNFYVGLKSKTWGSVNIGRLDSGTPTGSPLYSQIINIVSFSPANAGISAIGTSIANTRNRTSNAIGYASNDINGWTYRARFYSNDGAMFNFWDGDNHSLDVGADFKNDTLRFSAGYGKDWSDAKNALDYKWQTGIRLNAYKPIQPYVFLGRDIYETDNVDYLIAGTKFSKDKHSIVLNYAQRDILNQRDATFSKEQISYLYDVNKQLNFNVSYNRDEKDYGDRNTVSKGFGIGVKYDFNLFNWK